MKAMFNDDVLEKVTLIPEMLIDCDSEGIEIFFFELESDELPDKIKEILNSLNHANVDRCAGTHIEEDKIRYYLDVEFDPDKDKIDAVKISAESFAADGENLNHKYKAYTALPANCSTKEIGMLRKRIKELLN